MAKFIELLRQSGKYDRSAIVFQSDHAEYFRTSGFFPTMDEGKNNEIARSHLLGMNGHNIDARSRALLLIKPPYADDRPLQVLKRETQLLDLPATITALLKLPARYSLGVNVFTPDFPLERRIDMYDGFAQRGPNGKGVVRLGQQILSAYVNHYSYSSRDGWKVHPNEMAQW
jgi:phosphoglycerol transferase MdoB-like AlkP superfamily enzyme